MNVLIDTSVWSLALRRRPLQLNGAERAVVTEWAKLVREGRARLTGAIRQELLSGIRREADFHRLRERLADFDDVPVSAEDHETAARFFNRCRSKGVAATATDMLIAALAQQHGLAVFTTDKDFKRYAALLPIRLHQHSADTTATKGLTRDVVKCRPKRPGPVEVGRADRRP